MRAHQHAARIQEAMVPLMQQVRWRGTFTQPVRHRAIGCGARLSPAQRRASQDETVRTATESASDSCVAG